MKKSTKEASGITLIALVITIIVLLILTAVSIATLTGENGVLTKANDAKEKSIKSQAEEEIELAVGALQIEEISKEMTQEEKRQLLEDELKQQQLDSIVTVDGTGFLAKHRGYEFEIDSKYNVKEIFNSEEWDKTANEEDLFEWDETGTIIVGFKDTLAGHEKIRIPSKCIAIIPDSVWTGSSSKRELTSRGVKKVELPDTITRIGACSFANFKELIEINIPDNVTNIESKAFMQTGIKSITIPNSVITIGDEAFQSCESLTNITIPSSVVSIGRCAFLSTEATSIIVDSSNKVYDSRNDCNAIIETASNKLIQGCCNTKIPNSVTSIEENAFSVCDSLTSIVIPESIISIGDMAFRYCENLANVTILEGVKNLGIATFENCIHLTSVKIPSTVTYIEQQLFKGCTSLASITIPESVTYIDIDSFGDSYYPISDTAVYNVVEGSYADTWVQTNKDGNQTINYITE